MLGVRVDVVVGQEGSTGSKARFTGREEVGVIVAVMFFHGMKCTPGFFELEWYSLGG